jgi:signal transduction histidine kinase/DNA-binding response OmpR family regulator
MSETGVARLLIVDDEPALMDALCRTLELEGYSTTGFTSARAALEQLASREFDILLTDLMMPEMDGIALLRAAQQIDRDLVGIVMTGHGTIDTAVKALQAGALDYVTKPFRLDNLIPALTRALATRRLQTENIRLREAVSIYELSRAITRGLEHDEIVQSTLAAATQQHEAGTVCMLVPTQDGRDLRVVGAVGSDFPWSQNTLVPLDPALVEWVAKARDQLSVWDGSGPLAVPDSRVVSDSPTSLPSVGSHLAVVFQPPFGRDYRGVALPILAGGNFYGVLAVGSRAAGRRLSPGQVKALDILANTAAQAFEAASLLAQLRSMNQELEQRVLDRTRELEASNADLESFSYSVSHDLRAPLRAIDGFCQILVSDHGSQIPQEARDYLAKVCTGVARMQRLIDDLLHLARFTRVPLETHRVRMTDLVRRVAANVQLQWGDRRVQLEVADLPDCHADGSLLEQVLTNLLSNSYKFTSALEGARVEVGAYKEGGEQVYFVRDNGVGFDMKHADKLFGVFQRMHSQAQFPGTGIGLSIVHRIIRRHGGRTWAHSKVREGTTIYFSLPLVPATGRESDSRTRGPDARVTSTS